MLERAMHTLRIRGGTSSISSGLHCAGGIAKAGSVIVATTMIDKIVTKEALKFISAKDKDAIVFLSKLCELDAHARPFLGSHDFRKKKTNFNINYGPLWLNNKF